jgi:outer membrane protein
MVKQNLNKMKKILTLLVVLSSLTLSNIQAQKFAVVDTEYILDEVPEYKAAQTKLNDLSGKWEQEVNEMIKEVDQLYKNYQADRIILSEEMRKKREEEISEKERAIAQFRKEKFGKSGALYQERQKLVKPIQDKVYNAIKKVAETDRYAMILDTASELSVLYSDPKYDISDEVLKVMGYK